MSREWKLLVLAASAVLLLATSVDRAQQAQFHAGITLVPVDVRVVEWNGKPVTTLTQADFTLYENGVRQSIAHFATKMAADARNGLLTSDRLSDRASSTNRIFLLVLADGNIQGPSRGIDGLVGFLRGLAPTDRVAILAGTHASAFTTDHEALAQSLIRMKRLAGGRSTSMPEWDQLVGPDDGGGTGRTPTLADYEDGLATDGQDASRLYAAIQYLRTIEGEKHLVFVTPFGDGLSEGRGHEDGQTLSVVAEDARVAIDLLQVGGTCGCFVLADAERVSQRTGGVVSMYSFASKGLRRIDQAASFVYELGYYPTNPTLDQKLRKIDVKVDRGHVDVLYRHGYVAHDPPPSLTLVDLRRYGRVEAAAMRPVILTGIPIHAATAIRTVDGKSVDVHVALDPSALTLTAGIGRHSGSVDLAVICANVRGAVVGSSWAPVAINLPDALYDRYAREAALPLDVHVAVKDGASVVKVIVYDPPSDHTGSILASVVKPKKTP